MEYIVINPLLMLYPSAVQFNVYIQCTDIVEILPDLKKTKGPIDFECFIKYVLSIICPSRIYFIWTYDWAFDCTFCQHVHTPTNKMRQGYENGRIY